MALQEYIDLKKDVKELLITYGGTFNLSRPTPNSDGSVTDKILGSKIAGTLDSQLVNFLNTNAGGIIATDKKTLYLIPFANEPEVGDVITNDSKNVWRVTNIEYWRPDDKTLICWMLTLT